jgi:hypothetical protein
MEAWLALQALPLGILVFVGNIDSAFQLGNGTLKIHVLQDRRRRLILGGKGSNLTR